VVPLTMPNCLATELERAQNEYDALEASLKVMPEFRAYLESLQPHRAIEPPPPLKTNVDFRRWLSLASRIADLHRMRQESEEPSFPSGFQA
jgi:hypothetical protein